MILKFAKTFLLTFLISLLILVSTSCEEDTSSPKEENNNNAQVIFNNGEMPNGEFGDGFIFEMDENGNISIVYPDNEENSIIDEEPNPEVEQLRMPFGALYNKDDILYLEDGTIVVPYRYQENDYIEHISFFSDGTTALSYYVTEEGDSCNYSDACFIIVQYKDADNNLLKEEKYIKENMYRYSYTEYNYTTIEQESVLDTYLSSTVSYYISEEGTSQKTVSEFDPYCGSDKPYKVSHYEDSKLINYYEYKYSLSGKLRKQTGYLPDGTIFLIQSYGDNDELAFDYNRDDDGDAYTVYYDDNGQITPIYG